jgi:hypothetical protein
MFANTMTLTVNGDAITMTRVNQENYSSSYYGVSTDGQRYHTMSIKHTLPKKEGDAESHMVRIDTKFYDSTGVYLREQSVWFVLKVHDASQDSAAMNNVYTALATLWSSSEMLRVVGRES